MSENEDNNITVQIETTQGTWKTTFPKTTKVQEVIQAILSHFGFVANGRYELLLDNDPDNALTPERPLVSYSIEDNDVLVFTDLGIAV